MKRLLFVLALSLCGCHNSVAPEPPSCCDEVDSLQQVIAEQQKCIEALENLIYHGGGR